MFAKRTFIHDLKHFIPNESPNVEKMAGIFTKRI